MVVADITALDGQEYRKFTLDELKEFRQSNLSGLKGSRSASVTTLHSDNMDGENTLDNPDAIRLVETTAACESKKNATVLNDRIPAKSFRMYRIK